MLDKASRGDIVVPESIIFCHLVSQEYHVAISHVKQGDQ